MQLIFLDRGTLKYKDNAFLSSNFEINLDFVVSQRSTFVVNKLNINATVGDIVVLNKEPFSYIGILETLEVTNTCKTTIKTLDFKEIFNIEVPVESYSGDIAIYIERKIKDAFIHNSDYLQNLPYLEIEIETSKVGLLSFELDKLMKITDLIELVSKMYGVSVISEVIYLRGRITGIKIKIIEVKSGIKLKSNISAITNLIINDSSNQVVSKVVFYPRNENTIYKKIESFYLLTNGEITQNEKDSLRVRSLNIKASTFTDSDFSTLPQKARGEMISSKLDHNITFNLKTDNEIINPFKNMYLGDFIEFYHGYKIYDSVVTGFRFIDGFNIVLVTLGEYRIKLTEKLQILNKNINNAVGSITNSINVTDLDGGEY